MDRQELNSYIASVKDGNSDALVLLFDKYQPVVYKLRQMYSVKDLDFEDWQQEGRLCLLQSAESYREDVGITFGAYFKKNMTRRIYSLLRKQNAFKRRMDVLATSLENEVGIKEEVLGTVKEEPTDYVSDLIVLRDELATYCQCLSNFECLVLLGYLTSVPLCEIAVMTECSEEKVKNGIDRARRKLKNITS